MSMIRKLISAWMLALVGSLLLPLVSIAAVSGPTCNPLPYATTTAPVTFAEHTVAIETVCSAESALRSMASGQVRSLLGQSHFLNAPKKTHMHHQTPREVLKQLPDDVANNPSVRGKPGMPNRRRIAVPEHKRIHKGKGGGPANELTKQKIRDLGREPTVDDVLRIRNEVNTELNIQYE